MILYLIESDRTLGVELIYLTTDYLLELCLLAQGVVENTSFSCVFSEMQQWIMVEYHLVPSDSFSVGPCAFGSEKNTHQMLPNYKSLCNFNRLDDQLGTY